MKRPVLIEVITPMISYFYHCSHCEYMANQADLRLSDRVHNEELNEYPEDWKNEFLRLNAWIRAMLRHYGPYVRLRVLDPQSLVGFIKALRYRAWRYPTFVVEGQTLVVGWDAEPSIHEAIRHHLAARGFPVPDRPFTFIWTEPVTHAVPMPRHT